MKKRSFLRMLFFRGGVIAFFFISYNAMGQIVIRQCISSYATSSGSSVKGQTSGQSYSTFSPDGAEVFVLQGFQQPESLQVEEVDVEPVYELSISVYPNPAMHKIMLRTSEQSEKWSVRVIDAKGAHVFSQNRSTLDEFEVNCNAWQNGFYFMNISDGKNTKTLKVLIER